MKKIIVAVVVVLVVLVVNFATETYVARERVKACSSAVLSMMANPSFSNADLLLQVSGTKANLEMWNTIEGMVYMSIPRTNYFTGTLERLTSFPERVEFAKRGDRQEVGTYVLNYAQDKYFFRFPSKDFVASESTIVKIPFSRVVYRVTVGELTDFLENRGLYNGLVFFSLGVTDYGENLVISNLGRVVVKPGEPSLTRLVSDLTKGLTTNEEKAQAILTFVTDEISYNHKEKFWAAQVIKRPSESLMTKTSYCAGKTTLLASLYEQSGLDYLIGYYPNHATIFVEGNYPNHNSHGVKIDGKDFALAEGTCPGIQDRKNRS
ncbi:MAG: transglutaminase-like domain-containing protein [bacterium]|nr:transglutaminase-like domain-containing protein [bacterium]